MAYAFNEGKSKIQIRQELTPLNFYFYDNAEVIS